MNIADLQTSDAPLSTLAATHDVYWCIEELAGLTQWRQLQKETVSVHVAAFAQSQAAQKTEEGQKRPQPKPYPMRGSKAVLSLSGTLMKSPSSWSDATSTVYFRRKLGQAVNDPDVSEIVLVIDSPGGTAAGTNDAADAVRAAAGVKPVIAYCEDVCCSAAYWIASQASKIVANPTAMVGSIGTLLVIYDYSRMAANEGIEPLVFKTGMLKGAGVPGAPITEEQKAHFQRIVDDLNSHFLAAVQQGRGFSEEQLSAVKTADVWVGQAAVDMGLVDEIASLETVLTQGASADINAAQGGRRKPQMRALFAKALAALGATRMAAALLGGNGDEPEAVANDAARALNEEVQSRVDAHPVMKALAGAGIQTDAEATALIADAKAYRTEAETELQTQAIRAFGQEAGVARAQAMQALPAADKREMAKAFQETADAKFGTTAEAGPDRVSANKKLPYAESAESSDQPESLWAQLTSAELKIAARMGYTNKSPEESREKYAERVIERR